MSKQTTLGAGVREPRQERSADTLRRLADSARRTLEAKSFDETTLSELVAGAGVTTGAFYSRFEGKEALLDYLEREAYDDLRAHLVKATDQPKAITLQEGIRQFLSAMAYLYREHGGTLRAIVLSSRSNPERNARRMKFTGEMIAQGVAGILELEGRIRHPDPPRAVKIALLFATAALRDVLLFDEDWVARSGDVLTDTELIDELTSAVLAYLDRAPG